MNGQRYRTWWKYGRGDSCAGHFGDQFAFDIINRLFSFHKTLKATEVVRLLESRGIKAERNLCGLRSRLLGQESIS